MAEISDAEKAQDRRAETLLAIRSMARAFLSGEDLSDHRLGQQLEEIGRGITECGITDEEIREAVDLARREMPPEEDCSESPKIVPIFGPGKHDTDSAPELLAMRAKHASHVVGGHALAKKMGG